MPQGFGGGYSWMFISKPSQHSKVIAPENQTFKQGCGA
jgi:hypothetical protein